MMTMTASWITPEYRRLERRLHSPWRRTLHRLGVAMRSWWRGGR